MFSRDLREEIAKAVPKINPAIGRGLVTSHINQGEAYLDSVWRVVNRSFPEGLEYTGCRRLTPQEEFALRTKRSSSRPPQIDLARCDFRYMVYMLKYNGEPLEPVYLQIPFVSDGGGLWISGSRYVYSPILSDCVISVNQSGIFVRLLQIKLTFNRETYCYGTNSHTVPREIIPVVWSKVWNGKVTPGSASNRISGETTIAHYMFAKYGATEAFRLFANANPVFGTEETINEENYPRSDWVICYSVAIQSSRRRKKYTDPSDLRVAVRISEYTQITKSLIAGLFYVTDRFTYRMDYMEVDRINTWRIMLGILIFGMERGEGQLLVDIDEHISSMDRYVDHMVSHNLARIGHDVKDIYQLFAIILKSIDDWIIANDENANTAYGKELTTLYSLYFDISTSIFHFYFELKKQLKRNPTMTMRQLNETLRVIKPGAIFGLKSGHGEISVDDYVGACMPLKTTATVVPQNRATVGAKSHTSISNPEFRFHQSWVEVYGFASMAKASPTGDTRLSPYLNIDASGKIIPNPKYEDLIKFIGEVTSRHPAMDDDTLESP